LFSHRKSLGTEARAQTSLCQPPFGPGYYSARIMVTWQYAEKVRESISQDSGAVWDEPEKSHVGAFLVLMMERSSTLQHFGKWRTVLV